MADTSRPTGPRLSPAQQKLNRQREGLLLSRKRLLRQLQAAAHPQHRHMLQQALSAIDKQVSSFDKLTGPANT